MAHVQVRMVNLSIAGDMTDQPVSIDCWRATLIFLTDRLASYNILIDGIPWDFLQDDNGQYHSQRIELGGAYMNGRPIKVKHDLRITTPLATGGSPFRALLVLQDIVEDGK